MRELHLTSYGNVILERGYCCRCDSMSIIDDGIYECCGAVVAGYKERKVKHVCAVQPELKKRSLPPVAFREALEAQENKCIYCGDEFYVPRLWRGKVFIPLPTTDHVTPFPYARDNRVCNLVLACRVCNGLKLGTYFDTIEEAKAYVTEKRAGIERHWKVQELRRSLSD